MPAPASPKISRSTLAASGDSLTEAMALVESLFANPRPTPLELEVNTPRRGKARHPSTPKPSDMASPLRRALVAPQPSVTVQPKNIFTVHHARSPAGTPAMEVQATSSPTTAEYVALHRCKKMNCLHFRPDLNYEHQLFLRGVERETQHLAILVRWEATATFDGQQWCHNDQTYKWRLKALAVGALQYREAQVAACRVPPQPSFPDHAPSPPLPTPSAPKSPKQKARAVPPPLSRDRVKTIMGDIDQFYQPGPLNYVGGPLNAYTNVKKQLLSMQLYVRRD